MRLILRPVGGMGSLTPMPPVEAADTNNVPGGRRYRDDPTKTKARFGGPGRRGRPARDRGGTVAAVPSRASQPDSAGKEEAPEVAAPGKVTPEPRGVGPV